MITYNHLDPQESTLMKFESNWKLFVKSADQISIALDQF